MPRKRLIDFFVWFVAVAISLNSFAQQNAMQMLEDLYEKGPKKEEPVGEQVKEIWYYFYTQEPKRWEDSEYQKSMIITTLNIEQKYGKISLNPFHIHSFSALKFLIDQLATNLAKEDEAIRYCYVIVAHKVSSETDDPVMFYFSQKAVETWKLMVAEKKIVKFETLQNLLLTLEYAPYEGADKDAWEILVNIPQRESAFFCSYIDSLAVIHWRLRKELSNEQLDYIFSLLEKVDEERLYNPDFILLIAKDRKYAMNLINMKKFTLRYKEIREIQDYMVHYMKINIFERGDF